MQKSIIYFFSFKISSGGLYPGDIITSINGREVKNSGDVYELLSAKERELNITIYRGVDRMTVKVTPEDADAI